LRYSKPRGLEQRTSEPQRTRPTSIDCGASQPPKLSGGSTIIKTPLFPLHTNIFIKHGIYTSYPRYPRGGRTANNQNLKASEARLYTFSPETKTALRKFRLGTSRAKDPQAVICKQHISQTTSARHAWTPCQEEREGYSKKLGRQQHLHLEKRRPNQAQEGAMRG